MVAAHLLICAKCGNLRSVCSDPSVDWHPQESVCWPTATRQWGERRLHEEHKDFDPKARDSNGELGMSPLDGVSVWVSDIDYEALSERVGDQDRKDGDQQDQGDLP